MIRIEISKEKGSTDSFQQISRPIFEPNQRWNTWFRNDMTKAPQFVFIVSYIFKKSYL